jgi:hypothetical protein
MVKSNFLDCQFHESMVPSLIKLVDSMLQGKPIARDKIICHSIVDTLIVKIGPKFNNKGLPHYIVLWIGWHLH